MSLLYSELFSLSIWHYLLSVLLCPVLLYTKTHCSLTSCCLGRSQEEGKGPLEKNILFIVRDPYVFHILLHQGICRVAISLANPTTTQETLQRDCYIFSYWTFFFFLDSVLLWHFSAGLSRSATVVNETHSLKLMLGDKQLMLLSPPFHFARHQEIAVGQGWSER